MKIFLADLGHNQLTISSDVFPLGIANLACYLQANLSPAPVISLFREPEDLKKALDAECCDVLGLSSYSWNHQLSLQFARYAKSQNQEVLTLMGGPNFPLTVEEQVPFLKEMPDIDIAVRGPTYEGERAMLNMIRRILDSNGDRNAILDEPVAGNQWIHPASGEHIVGPEVERISDLDEIPSPYVMGWMDRYFDTGYFPMMQISRGCPFSCSFCNSSPASNSRIFSHSIQNVQADLLYIAERVRPEAPLCFADDNFGMYTLDEEVADYIAYLQDRFGWPNYIRTTTGKNRGERIIRIMRKIRGSLPMTAAVQSLDPVVLKNIDRSNIKLSTYAEIQKEVQSQGMQAYGELILCLPGETKQTFMKAVSDLMDTGVKRVSAHQLMLLHGAPLSNPESRERFQFKTRFRIVARNLGNYTGEPVVEVEEMVVETPTFSFQEYLDVRVFHLLLTIFYYEGNFEEPFAFAMQEGVKPFEVIVQMQKILEQAPPRFLSVIRDYVKENQDELFETKEECLEWARENFDGLLDGSLGGNLLSKYSMIGRFFVAEEAMEFLETSIGACLQNRDPETGAMLKTVMDYLHSVVLSAPFAVSLNRMPEWVAQYDVEAWRADGYKRNLREYRFPELKRFSTSVESERKALIESRIQTFGEHPSGLGKFTRTIFARDLRRKILPV
jgi:radical SAM superfamily enzyme YgiQ (UPF0313 family)